MRRPNRFSDTRITGMNNEDQDYTENSIEQGRQYEVYQSTNSDHSVHPGV